MTALQDEAFFAGIREMVRFRLYYHPDVWKHIDYPGSSKEYGGYIYQNSDGTFSYTFADRGTDTQVQLTKDHLPPDVTIVGDYHTHADNQYPAAEKFHTDIKM